MTTYSPLFGDYVGPWRWHFAWLPVRLFDGARVWLRWVHRRRVQLKPHLIGGPDQWWAYKLPGDPA